jgi:hypothetical protein
MCLLLLPFLRAEVIEVGRSAVRSLHKKFYREFYGSRRRRTEVGKPETEEEDVKTSWMNRRTYYPLMMMIFFLRPGIADFH